MVSRLKEIRGGAVYNYNQDDTYVKTVLTEYHLAYGFINTQAFKSFSQSDVYKLKDNDRLYRDGTCKDEADYETDMPGSEVVIKVITNVIIMTLYFICSVLLRWKTVSSSY